MFTPTGNVLTVCVCPFFVHFVTVGLIKGLSRPFLRSQIMALLKQDYPAFLQQKFFCKYTISPTVNKTMQSFFIWSRFATCSLGTFKVMTNYRSWGTELY